MASRRIWLGLGVLAMVAGLGLGQVQRTEAQEDLVDLTLLFHSATQGKIAPCG